MTRNCGRWSEIEVAILPEQHLFLLLFVKILSISKAAFCVTRAGSVICAGNSCGEDNPETHEYLLSVCISEDLNWNL